MEIPINRELKKSHIIIYQLLTVKTLWIFTKICTVKSYSFSVIDPNVASDKTSHFKKKLLERT